MPHTVLYTSYMVRVAATRPHAEGLAVLLPCFWVYMHVGKCMQALRSSLGDRCVWRNSHLSVFQEFLCS
jgi:thiaminase